ncbi:hypothetical protein DFJ58DRAFT_850265 [Suillus subalutaceus]|uniref:uncharacterized protein n=1 Tax=Suillus subalutaceus TaxID=48586 RepID=UPI001B86B03E|nr:uncharacterized protein DFJ58DRAFT_850265 [Suillus subalutaceus]KAG1818292.1 hypothetical protein DFJ58DRAFT_850265 [Suillus subalutaceus]
MSQRTLMGVVPLDFGTSLIGSGDPVAILSPPVDSLARDSRDWVACHTRMDIKPSLADAESVRQTIMEEIPPRNKRHMLLFLQPKSADNDCEVISVKLKTNNEPFVASILKHFQCSFNHSSLMVGFNNYGLVHFSIAPVLATLVVVNPSEINAGMQKRVAPSTENEWWQGQTSRDKYRHTRSANFFGQARPPQNPENRSLKFQSEGTRRQISPHISLWCCSSKHQVPNGSDKASVYNRSSCSIFTMPTSKLIASAETRWLGGPLRPCKVVGVSQAPVSKYCTCEKREVSERL